jgi:hypothetical protein
LLIGVVEKLVNNKKHLGIIFRFDLLSKEWVLPIFIVSLLAELYVSVSFLINQIQFGAIFIFVSMLVIYSLAIGINLFRGNIDFDCGCGGILENSKLTGWIIVRNMFLIVAAIMINLSYQIISSSMIYLITQILSLCIIVIIWTIKDLLEVKQYANSLLKNFF